MFLDDGIFPFFTTADILDKAGGSLSKTPTLPHTIDLDKIATAALRSGGPLNLFVVRPVHPHQHYLLFIALVSIRGSVRIIKMTVFFKLV